MGQKVWPSIRELPLNVKFNKLAPKFVRPFVIERIISPVAVQLQLPRSMRVHPTFHVCKIKPVSENLLTPAVPAPALPRLIDGGLTYTVRHVIHSCQHGRGYHYLMDWEGFGPEERSWVPVWHVLVKRLIKDFHRRYPDQPWAGPSNSSTSHRWPLHHTHLRGGLWGGFGTGGEGARSTSGSRSTRCP